MALTIVTAPAAEPISLSEAKDQCRVDHSSEDTFFTALIQAARERTETITRRALITQIWDLTLDRFPCSSNQAIDVPLGKLQSVVSITYVDTDGATQTWDSDSYKVDTKTDPGRIVPVYGEVWPTTRCEINAVTLRFTAGYGGADDVPQAIKQAMLLMIHYWWNNRDDSDAMPSVAKTLLLSHKLYGF